MKTHAVKLADLTPDPANARVHGAENLKAVCSSLTEFGQRRALVVWRQPAGLTVVAGNGTLEAARLLGWESVVVTEVPEDWDEVTVRAYALADNRTAELAAWDEDRLADYLEAATDEDLEAMGWTSAERDYLLGLDITPDRLGTDVTNDNPQPVGATAPVIVGPYRFSVDRDAYEKWQQTLAAECGYREDAIGAEIVRRIGL